MEWQWQANVKSQKERNQKLKKKKKESNAQNTCGNDDETTRGTTLSVQKKITRTYKWTITTDHQSQVKFKQRLLK